MEAHPRAAPLFLTAIKPFLREQEWFDAFVVACGLAPQPSLCVCKFASQKLSNLARFGHLERRPVRSGGPMRTGFEYRVPRAQPRPPVAVSWIPLGIA